MLNRIIGESLCGEPRNRPCECCFRNCHGMLDESEDGIWVVTMLYKQYAEFYMCRSRES
jgi:hypothetical protein